MKHQCEINNKRLKSEAHTIHDIKREKNDSISLALNSPRRHFT